MGGLVNLEPRLSLGRTILFPASRLALSSDKSCSNKAGQGLNVQEVNLRIPDNQTVLLMQRGAEGFFAVNKTASIFAIPSIDLTLTDLEGFYNELRNNFTVAIQSIELQ
jgi:hypothetical protein